MEYNSFFDREDEKTYENYLNNGLTDSACLLKFIYRHRKEICSLAKPFSIPDAVHDTICTSLKIKYGNALEKCYIYQAEKYWHANCFGRKCEYRTDDDRLKKSDIDFPEEINGIYYVGELKAQDNHDSSKHPGQMVDLESKAMAKYETLKKNIGEKKLESFILFLFPDLKKGKSFYEKRCKTFNEKHPYINMNVFYGDEMAKHFGLPTEPYYALMSFLKERKEGNSNIKFNLENEIEVSLNEILTGIKPKTIKKYLTDEYMGLIFSKCLSPSGLLVKKLQEKLL